MGCGTSQIIEEDIVSYDNFIRKYTNKKVSEDYLLGILLGEGSYVN